MRNLKRLGLLLLAMLLLCALSITAFAADAAPVEEPVCYNHGDMNSDGIVDNRDAIYTLYCFMLGEDFGYAANQDWDFDADGNKDNKDALYVLYAYMLDGIVDTYQLKGIVHEYYDPTWTWDTTGATVTASVTFKCGCGQTHTITTADTDGVTVTAGTVTAATCVTAGSAEYEAKVTFEGVEYTASTTVTTPAAGSHQITGTQGCETAAVCSVCGYEMPATGHRWVLDAAQSTEATCTAQAVQVYVCETCGQTKQVTLEGTVACQYEYIGDVNTTGCTYVKQYQCKSCKTVINGTAESDTYERHSYTATLTKEATCVSDGEKTYTCSVCGSSYTEAVAANGSHNWVEGDTANGVTSYSCGNEGCSETKTVVSSTSNEAALDSKDALDGNELQLGNGATLELDQDTVDGLDSDKQLIISVDEIDVDSTNLPDELKEQVGDNVVYDFTMVYTDGETITPVTNFDGKITVSLPYQLAEGEDIDSIDVWFINDEGEAEQVFGTYSNGYVTFTTEHFSYYSVTRLTPAQRCERYGHLTVDANKQATCTADGYSMSVCQRCGEQLSKTVIPMTGHNYVETTVAATCTADGSSKKVCANCNHTVSAVVPALGHSMELDASQSVAATCGAAGKNVYVCATCGHSTEEELAQLKHNYELNQSQTATCTGKGFDQYICSLCGGEDVRNEKAPLGHNYQVSQWNWSSDNLSATLELVCGNDESHTHSISAVVTSKATGTACDGQTITYTATASYNNISYTDTATGIGAAAGHTPGTSWITNANQHYHTCVVCGEKIDTEKHTWDEGTVTVEPTCSTAGSAIYTCTVCGYEKTKSVPATREHDYVNGFCSVCGKEEGNDCDHGMEEVGTFDLSTVGGCEGVFILYSCQCGQNTYLEPDHWSCEFTDFEETEETLPDGTVYYRQTGTCAVCGLTVEAGGYTVVDEDACTYYHVSSIDLYMDDVCVVDTGYISETYEHPTELTETVELTMDEHGLCGVILEIYSCYCGEETYVYRDSICEWECVAGDVNYTVYMCVNCGAMREETVTYDTEHGQCEVAEIVTVTYYVGDEEIYSYTEQYIYEDHNYEITDYELLGETCEDGVWVAYVCADCGEVVETEEYMHVYVVEQAVTDLSDYGFCASAVVQISCPCPVQHQIFEFVYEGEEECNWQWFGYDEETGAETLYCETCGLYMIILQAESVKDENCRVWEFFTYTFTDADGNVVAQAYVAYADAYHDYECEAILEGETCEDGVIVVYTCKDCGFSYEEYYGYHVQLAIESYDLADYGLCGGYVARYACACGEYDEFYVNEACDWYWDDEDENNLWLYCRYCGAEAHRYYEYLDSGNPCLTVMNVTYTYSLDGVELLSVTCQETYEHHEYTYDITLNEGAESCADGYTYTAICQICGDYYIGSSDWCREIELSRVDIPEGIFCGSAQLVTYGCVCGQVDGSAYIEWTSDSACEFYYGYWDEETGVEYAVCESCGLRRDIVRSNAKAEGSCKRYYTTEYIYSRDGEVLYSYTYSEWDWSHRMVSTFELEGESCEDGYFVSQTCLDCDKSNYWYEEGCYTYPISWEEVPDGIFCGKAYLINYACPCGQRGSQNLTSDCVFEWYDWDEETNSDIYQCMKCGLMFVYSSTSTRLEGQCAVQYERQYTYLRDDVEVYSYGYTYLEESHRYVYGYEMNGLTCDDGYTVSCVCVDCDDSDSWTSSGCYSRPVERCIVEDGILCGRAEIVTYRCGCGNSGGTELVWWGEEICDFQWDSEAGCNVCSQCGIVYDYESERTEDLENCKIYYNYHHIYSRDGEVVLEYVSTELDWVHDFIYSYELDGESCQDGYTYTCTCRNCGYAYSGSGSWHRNEVTGREEIPEGIFCGSAELVTTGCACGYYGNAYIEWTGDTGCDFWGHYDSDLDCYVYECDTCGIAYYGQWTYTADAESCRVYNTCERIYILDGETVYSYTYTDWDTNHKYIYTFELEGETCNDGYYAYYTCQSCGYSDYYYSTGHSREIIAREPVEDGIFCGDAELATYSCACGYYYSTNLINIGCEWEEQYDEELDQWDIVCSVCGLEMSCVYTETQEEGTCRVFEEYAYAYSRDGEVVYSFTEVEIGWNHKYLCTIELNGETCNDGYTATYTCLTCGDSYTYTGSGHSSGRILSYEEIPEGAFCGSAELVTTGCGCGYNHYVYINWTGDTCCSFVYGYLDGVGYCEYCTECGVIKTDKSDYFMEDGTCKKWYTVTYTYTRDGEVVYTYTDSEWGWEHSYIYTFELDGETCSDGYTATYTCQTCGISSSYHSSSTSREVVSRELLPEGSFCDKAYLITESCACGCSQNKYIYWPEGGCDFESQYDEDLDQWVEVCTECGVVYSYVSHYYYDASACKNYYTDTYTYSRDGEELLSYTNTDWSTQHNMLASFELLGETCDDGYYVTYTCHCGYTDAYSSVYYGCESRYTVERIYLSEYGMCGGYLRVTSCACGDSQWWDCAYYYCDYEWVEDTEDGYDQFYCADCNTYIVRDSDYEYVQESCAYVGEWIFRIIRDGETLLDRTGILREPHHDYQVVNAVLDGETCEDGVTLYFECTVCGRSKTSETSYHYEYVISTVDLGELGTCGGTVKNYSCACGYDSYADIDYDCYLSYVSSWNETDENGVDHYYSLYRCSTCGFEKMYEEYTVYPEGSCTGKEYDVYTYIFDGTVVVERTSTYTVTNHSYEYSYALAEGATVCSDGVVETYTCSVCGRTGSYTRYYSCSSNMIERDRIDLSEYGSVCGGYLAHSTCVCGQIEDYMLVDYECDYDRRSTTAWIEDCVSGYNHNTEGYNYFSNYFYTYTCAVTDPACGMKLRYASYWLVEGCEAVQYETWQLGYDAETDTCLMEITYATGSRRTYHPYEYTSTEETLEDGTTVYRYSYVCPNCASSYLEEGYYGQDGYCIKYVEEAVNTLDDGKNKYYSCVYEYVEYREGYYDTSLMRSEYMYADGSEYWYQYAYTYDNTCCLRTVVYADSEGDTNTSTSTYHSNSWSYETLKESTCTQFGEYREYAVCKYCGETTYDYTYADYPDGHNWYWDSEKEIYYCYDCGLENANGADGDIVLEDMTTEDGTDYVVGYWNSADVIFTTYASVIITQDGEEIDELVLTDIEIRYLTVETDGVCAVALDKAAAQEAAAAAMAETYYTGTYAIRISFVPANSDTTLDYSITFDSITAE